MKTNTLSDLGWGMFLLGIFFGIFGILTIVNLPQNLASTSTLNSDPIHTWYVLITPMIFGFISIISIISGTVLIGSSNTIMAIENLERITTNSNQCPKCKHQIEYGQLYCPECGNKL